MIKNVYLGDLMTKKNIVKVCRKHNKTKYVLRTNGSYRCLKCASEAVSKRRKNIKIELIKIFGGKCIQCGYNKCVGALHFHHKDFSKKKFELSARGITRAFKKTLEEAKKCILICSNCHAEIHAGLIKIPS